jgi:hypothetical protein
VKQLVYFLNLKTKKLRCYIIQNKFHTGQKLSIAASLYADRESHIFAETSDRLTFKSLKEKVK